MEELENYGLSLIEVRGKRILAKDKNGVRYLIPKATIKKNMKITMRCVIDKEKYIKHILLDKFKGNITLREEWFKYIDCFTMLPLTCKKHGIFEIKYKNIYERTYACEDCVSDFMSDHNKRINKIANGNKSEKTRETFLEDCIKIHNDRYTYIDINYEKIEDKIRIFCPVHGEFRQSAINHKNGSGCPNCKALKNVWSFDILKQHGLDKETILYIIKCYDEEELFYKIGITTRKSVKARFASAIPYNYEIEHETIGDVLTMFETEKVLHSLLVEYSYKPNKTFGGHTECYNFTEDFVQKLKNNIPNIIKERKKIYEQHTSS